MSECSITLNYSTHYGGFQGRGKVKRNFLAYRSLMVAVNSTYFSPGGRAGASALLFTNLSSAVALFSRLISRCRKEQF